MNRIFMQTIGLFMLLITGSANAYTIIFDLTQVSNDPQQWWESGKCQDNGLVGVTNIDTYAQAAARAAAIPLNIVTLAPGEKVCIVGHGTAPAGAGNPGTVALAAGNKNGTELGNLLVQIVEGSAPNAVHEINLGPCFSGLRLALEQYNMVNMMAAAINTNLNKQNMLRGATWTVNGSNGACNADPTVGVGAPYTIALTNPITPMCQGILGGMAAVFKNMAGQLIAAGCPGLGTEAYATCVYNNVIVTNGLITFAAQMNHLGCAAAPQHYMVNVQ